MSAPLLPFHSFIITVEVQTNPLLGLSDKPSYTLTIPVSMILREQYNLISSETIRPSHLSWAQLCDLIEAQCGFAFDVQTCELGFTTQSTSDAILAQYFEIASELTFHNALAVMYNDWDASLEQRAALFVRLWHPRPTEPTFRRSSRARLSIQPKPVSATLQPPFPSVALESQSSASDASAPIILPQAPTAQPAAPIALPAEEPSTSQPPSNIAASPDEEDIYKASSPELPKLEVVRSQSHAPTDHAGDNDADTTAKSDKAPHAEDNDEEAAEDDDEEGEEPAFEVDWANLMAHLPKDGMQLPDRKDFDLDQEYDEAVGEYLDYVRRLELARFQQGCESQACMHFNDKIWQEVCVFFGHDITKTKAEYYGFVPGGFSRKLLPCQLHGTWHALREIHGLAGSLFMCHIMGIGKTTMALAVHHVQHVFNKMWAEIHRVNSNTPGKHWAKNSEDEMEQCPSNAHMKSKYGFDCPCHPSSLTHFLKEKLGLSVALVPVGLLVVWRAEHKACFAENPNHQLLVAHKALGTKENDAKALDSLIVGKLDSEGEFDEESVYEARLENGLVLVVSTPDSFHSQFIDRWSTRKHFDITPDPTWNPKTQKFIKHHAKPHHTKLFSRIVVSMVFRDEFQLRKTQTIQAITKLQTVQNYELRHLSRSHQGRRVYHRFSLIAISGTPLVRGPEDIAPFVQVMCWDSWSLDQVLQGWMTSEIQTLGKQWNTWIRAKNPEDNKTSTVIMEKLTPLVERIMIRWTTDSLLCGEKAVKAPVVKHAQIKCRNSKEWSTRVNALGEDEKKKLQEREQKRKAEYRARHGSLANYQSLDTANINIYYRSRVCASFPALMDLVDEDMQPLRLSESEWIEKTTKNNKTGREVSWYPETELDPYYANLDKIVASSGKLRQLHKKMDDFDKFLDAEDRPCRQIIFSYFFTVTYVMYLWMKYTLKIPENDFIFLNKTMTQKNIDNELARFHLDLDSEVPLEDQTPARYIVATSASFAVGLTLAEAISVLCMEPDFHLDTILQAYYRHCRQGNKNPEVYTFQMYIGDHVVEKDILETTAARLRIQESHSRSSEEATRALTQEGTAMNSRAKVSAGREDIVLMDLDSDNEV